MQLFKFSLLLLFIGLFIYSCGTESKPTYTVNTSASPTEGGTIQLSPSEETYEEGTQVSVTGTPNENWVFSKWNGTKSSAQNPFTFTVDENTNLTGVFSKKTYPLNITFEGEGTVSEQIIQSKRTDYEVGTLVELTPNPSDGWKFVEWNGDVQSSESVIQITVDSPVNITVVFEKKSYPLTITVEGSGTVEENVIQSKSTDYDFGTVVELTPIPSEGWEFLEWSGDVESQEEVIEITINQETNIIVTFDKPFYLHPNGVTIMCPNTDPGEKGFVDGLEYESVDRELLIQRRDEDSDLTKVCTSLVTDMNGLFHETNFNQPIGNWDVSNVSDMRLLFRDSSFNQPIENWDVSNVTNMTFMFSETSFNQPLNQWDVSNVTNMAYMFWRSPFNQPLNQWDVSNVIYMSRLFQETPFNQRIENWNVSNVTNMDEMFKDSNFIRAINDWDVSNVADMSGMFRDSNFNQPIGDWDVSTVEDMSQMFYDSPFDKSIENWNVSNVRDMSFMFSQSEFNQSIGNWDVSSVQDMQWMFGISEFNQPIGSWDVRNVRDMDSMFRASQFNQPINKWCVSNIPTEPEDFSDGSPLTEENKPGWGTCPGN